MTQTPIKRATTFIAALAAVIALPAAASASCGSIQGSFAVTCEQGVKVFRHQAPSSFPRGLTQAQAQLQAEEIRANTAESQLRAQERASVRSNELAQRELALEDFRVRIFDRSLRSRRSLALRSSFNTGFGVIQPLRVQNTRRSK